MISQKLLFVLLIALFLQSFVFNFVEAGKDYYEILGVKRDASNREIKKAFRDLSLKWHPDRNKDNPDASQRFIEISNAYEVLNDDDKRRKYDQFGEEGLKEGGRTHFTNPFDIFKNFGFGGGQQEPQENKGPATVIPLEITLKDLYLGKELKVAHKKQILCPKCRGTGAKKAEDVTICSKCKGSGTVMFTQQLGPGFVTQTQRTCDKCGGKGKVVKSTCPSCNGKKVSTGEDTFTVLVERGMVDGFNIHFESEGDEEPDVTPGDVVFRVVTLPDSVFSRNGRDLHMTFKISLLEALVGFSKTIKHFDDHDVIIAKTDVTKPGEILKIPEEGMPVHEYPTETGDLYVKFEIIMPKSVTEEQKEAFKKLLP